MAKKIKPRDEKKVHVVFIDSIHKIAKGLRICPHKVTEAQFNKSDPNRLSTEELRSAGSFANLKKLYFTPPVENADVKHGARLISSHRNKLEKWYGTEKFMTDEVIKCIDDALKNGLIRMHPTVKKAVSKKSKKKPRTIMAHLSDTHYGCNIETNEVGGLNAYNWEIAARRTALFIDQIVNYKPHYRGDTDLELLINGDIIAGMIHDQEWFADLLTTQFIGTLDLLTQAISYLCTQFRVVNVRCTPGNHGRAMHKTSKQRATTHKWDSYETMIYSALKRVVEATHKNVKVEVTKAPFCIVKLYGHNFFVTHGDTVINVGNPGKNLNMKDINDQINKLNASKLGGKSKFSAVIVGHVHTATVQLLESGCMLLINGCLSGLDPFANAIGIFDSHPTLQLFEVTEKYAVGDMRFIQVKAADTMKDLDKIIKPYKGEL